MEHTEVVSNRLEVNNPKPHLDTDFCAYFYSSEDKGEVEVLSVIPVFKLGNKVINV